MNPPKFPLHIGDYKRDTGHLRAAGHGAYLLLLMHYWSTGALPTDDKHLATIAAMSLAEWKKIRPVIAPFFQDDWTHPRVERDLAEARAHYEKRANAGKRGGNARALLRQKPSNARDGNVAMLEQNPSNAQAGATVAMLPQPLTNNHKKEEREEREERKQDAPDGASVVGKYAFESGTIRLVQKDFDQWRQAFANLNLEAELLSLTKWASQQGKDWFFAVSSALAKRNREVGLKIQQAKNQPNGAGAAPYHDPRL